MVSNVLLRDVGDNVRKVLHQEDDNLKIGGYLAQKGAPLQ